MPHPLRGTARAWDRTRHSAASGKIAPAQASPARKRRPAWPVRSRCSFWQTCFGIPTFMCNAGKFAGSKAQIERLIFWLLIARGHKAPMRDQKKPRLRARQAAPGASGEYAAHAWVIYLFGWGVMRRYGRTAL